MRVSLGSALAGLVLALHLVVAPPRARAEDAAPTPGPITEWMAWYYLFPAPDRVGDFLAWLAAEKTLAKRPAAAVATGAFLAPIFAAHPDRVAAWVDPKIVTAEAREAAAFGLWLAGRADLARDLYGDLPKAAAAPPPDLKTRRPATPLDVDTQWAAFMADGDAAHIRLIVDALDDQIPLDDDRTVEKKTRAAAAWSLSANVLLHERVARLLATEATTRRPPVAKALTTLLSDSRRAVKPFPVHDGDFSGLVLVVDASNLATFQKPANEAIAVDRVARVERDRKVALTAVFMGQQLTDDLVSDVTWDVTITDPAGKRWSEGDLLGLEGLKGRIPSRWRVFDSRGFPTLWFTADDAPGVYTIRSVVRDNVSGRSLTFDDTIEYVK